MGRSLNRLLAGVILVALTVGIALSCRSCST
jgi:hypothetical protein